MNLEEFIVGAAGHGPCVGAYSTTPTPLMPPSGVEFRTVNGANITTLDALFDAVAKAWHFPPRTYYWPSSPKSFLGLRTQSPFIGITTATKPPHRQPSGYYTASTHL
ncbi:hypothetical protein TM48_03872 [Mycobacterium shottsii]|nr:hypothetical protein TM48_03872 [Mycobacterium shottsii]